MKVFGGLTFDNKGSQVRTIVAAKSMKRASELAGVNYSHMRAYWSATKNDAELQIALSEPETVFRSSGIFCKDFKPIKPN